MLWLPPQMTMRMRLTMKMWKMRTTKRKQRKRFER